MIIGMDLEKDYDIYYSDGNHRILSSPSFKELLEYLINDPQVNMITRIEER